MRGFKDLTANKGAGMPLPENTVHGNQEHITHGGNVPMRISREKSSGHDQRQLQGLIFSEGSGTGKSRT